MYTLGGHIMSENNEKDLNVNEEVEPRETLDREEADSVIENTDETPSMSEAMDFVDEVNVGDTVIAEVLTIDDDGQVIVGLQSGEEGVIHPRELSAQPYDDVNDIVKVGDEIEVVVIKEIQDKEQGSYQLSKKRVDAQKVWKELEEKFNNGETIEAPVTRVVKGGLVVDCGVRGFIPASLVDVNYIEDFSAYVGQTLELVITEIEPSENRLILSHKAIQEKELESQKAETLENLEEGQVVTGKVARIVDFGAFIDLGGVDGLVHISEIAHEHVDNPADHLTVGEDIEVKVLSVDPEKERISLSRKEVLAGPWDSIEEKISKGDVVDGKVKRLVDFGAFVEVQPGVEGLLHISQIAHRHISTPHEVLEAGQEIQVKVLEVSEEEERLSLSLKALEEPTPEEKAEQSNKPKNNQRGGGNQSRPQSRQTQDTEIESSFNIGDILGDQLSGLNLDDSE